MNNALRTELTATLRELSKQRLQAAGPAQRRAMARQRALNGLCSSCCTSVRKRKHCTVDITTGLVYCEPCTNERKRK